MVLSALVPSGSNVYICALTDIHSAAIEEEYGKRLQRLAKLPLGKDEIGDLSASLQSIQDETAAQASYHLSLSTDLHQVVEVPTTELANRYAQLKKGIQASVEKSWRNKGLQEGHVTKVSSRFCGRRRALRAAGNWS